MLLPPDSKRGTDLLTDTRSQVGVPLTNLHVFGRLNTNTPMAGGLAGLEYPEEESDLVYVQKDH